jgi:UPF0755 protein
MTGSASPVGATPPPRRRGSLWLRAFGVLFVLGAIAVASLVGAVLWGLRPADPGAAPVRFDVRAGSTLRSVAEELEAAGVIRSSLAMRGLARFQKTAGRLHAGEYELSASWNVRRVLEEMVEGRVVTYPVTLPEGISAAEIASRLEAAGLVSAAAFLEVARDPEVANAFGVEGTTLEGYLFPDTYRIPRGLTPRQIAKILVDEFHRHWTQIETGARARGMSMREVVTLATIVEKETGVASERPLVASVFHNRLDRGMRLESDPTTIYGIPDFDGNLRRIHLEDASNAWNTYRIAGLPPSPIASPGGAALRAVIDPAPSDYLFFVSRNDGSHNFARNYREHVNNVNRYQRSRRP